MSSVAMKTVYFDYTQALVGELLERVFLDLLSPPTFDGSCQNPPRPPPHFVSKTRWHLLAPLTLSHVCRRWREIALEYHKLWSFIHVDVECQLMTLFFVEEWIRRSVEHPLTIVFNGTSLSTLRNLEGLPSLAAICSVSHRWKKALITVNVEAANEPHLAESYMLGPLQSNDKPFAVPHLHTIVLRGRLPDGLQEFAQQLLSSSQRSLRQMHFLGHGSHSLDRAVTFQSATSSFLLNITNLTLMDIDPAMVAQVIRANTAARSITLGILPLGDTNDVELRRLIIPSSDSYSCVKPQLRTLRLITFPDIAALVLDRLVAPVLQCLELRFLQSMARNQRDLADVARHAVSSFVQRSGCHISQLSLSYRQGRRVFHSSDTPFPVDVCSSLEVGCLDGFPITRSLEFSRLSADSLTSLYLSSRWSAHLDFPNGLPDLTIALPILVQLAVTLISVASIEENDWSMRNLIAHLITPSLKKLRLTIPSWTTPMDFSGNHHFYRPVERIIQSSAQLFSHGCAQLTHLHLVDYDHTLQEDDLIQLLNVDWIYPTLESFIWHSECILYAEDHDDLDPIPHVNHTNELVDYLSYKATPGEGSLHVFHLQSLRSLLVFAYDCASFNEDGPFSDMLRTRFEEADLAFAAIEFPSKPSEERPWNHQQEDRRQAAELQQRGFNIVFTPDERGIGHVEREEVRREWVRAAGLSWDTFPEILAYP